MTEHFEVEIDYSEDFSGDFSVVRLVKANLSFEDARICLIEDSNKWGIPTSYYRIVKVTREVVNE